MKAPVDYIFPPVAPGSLPYWRRTLRGCSQLCFQSNELTGLFFLAAVLVTSPISAAYMLVAAIIAPAGRMLLGDRGLVLETGLAGLNPCLVALSLPAFFVTGWTNFEMWGVLLVCVALAIVMVRLFLAILPFPILVLPFLIIFWGLWLLEPHVEFLVPGGLGIVGDAKFEPIASVLRSLGAAAFVPTVLTGLLFLCGILLSNWRHAVIALIGAAIGTMVSYYYHHVDPGSADLGEYGFNGVLVAVAVYLVCGEKLRLAILGALLATILTPAISALGVPALGAPFVLTTWLLLALGWIEDRWFGHPDEAETTDIAVLEAANTPTQTSARNGD
jgi:urea transporter